MNTSYFNHWQTRPVVIDIPKDVSGGPCTASTTNISLDLPGYNASPTYDFSNIKNGNSY